MIRVTDQQFFMDGLLKMELDTICYNVPKDWDCVIIISGDGTTRTGKTHIAQQIGYYCSYKLGVPFSVDNMIFGGTNLISKGHELYKQGHARSVLIYDEAREGMDSKKIMQKYTQDILDFLNECGMYNHIIILVLPDFFELPKSIAINRSYCLINVFKTDVLKEDNEGEPVNDWQRGGWEFFNLKAKHNLFMKGKKFHDYTAEKRTHFGEFREFWVIDKLAYETKKLQFLTRDKAKGIKKKDMKFHYALHALVNLTSQVEASKLLKAEGYDISNSQISLILKDLKALKGGGRL